MKLGLNPTNSLLGNGLNYIASAGVTPPFTPTDIAGCVLWLDADQIIGLNDGDSVTTWEDMSTNSKDATQSDAAKKPTYETNEINNLPVVRFAGPFHFLSTPSITMTSMTIFAVLKATGSGYPISFQNESNENALIYGFVGGTLEIYNNPRLQIGNITTWKYISVTRESGVGTTTYLNGSQTNTSGSVWTTNTGTISIGRNFAGDYWQGDFAEIVIYDTALNATDRESVETYLATKYNL